MSKIWQVHETKPQQTIQHEGFPFSQSLQPFYNRSTSCINYLEWLVSIQYKLRHEFPDHTTNLSPFDIVIDNVRTTENFILVTLGRLEHAQVLFNRQQIFQNANEYKNHMNAYLKIYAFSPPCTVWISPLSSRFVEIESKTDDERATAMLLLKKIITILNQKIPTKFPSRCVRREQDMDETILAIMEDELLSLFSRFQFMESHIVNTRHENIVGWIHGRHGLLSKNCRRFLSDELIAYAEQDYDVDEHKSDLFIHVSDLPKKVKTILSITVPTHILKKWINMNSRETFGTREYSHGLSLFLPNIPPELLNIVAGYNCSSPYVFTGECKVVQHEKRKPFYAELIKTSSSMEQELYCEIQYVRNLDYVYDEVVAFGFLRYLSIGAFYFGQK